MRRGTRDYCEGGSKTQRRYGQNSKSLSHIIQSLAPGLRICVNYILYLSRL